MCRSWPGKFYHLHSTACGKKSITKVLGRVQTACLNPCKWQSSYDAAPHGKRQDSCLSGSIGKCGRNRTSCAPQALSWLLMSAAHETKDAENEEQRSALTRSPHGAQQHEQRFFHFCEQARRTQRLSLRLLPSFHT